MSKMSKIVRNPVAIYNPSYCIIILHEMSNQVHLRSEIYVKANVFMHDRKVNRRNWSGPGGTSEKKGRACYAIPTILTGSRSGENI